MKPIQADLLEYVMMIAKGFQSNVDEGAEATSRPPLNRGRLHFLRTRSNESAKKETNHPST